MREAQNLSVQNVPSTLQVDSNKNISQSHSFISITNNKNQRKDNLEYSFGKNFFKIKENKNKII